MYTQQIEFDDFFGKKHRAEVHFNLTEHEVFKFLVEFQAIFDWTAKMKDRDPEQATDTREVIEFYNNIEEIILGAWGEPDPSGLHFRKGGMYEFRESALFHACMKMFVEDPAAANKLVDGLMPKGLQEMVKKADANLAALAKSEDTDADLRVELERLRSQVASQMPQVTEVTAGASGQTVPGTVV